jgi:hypothetical protein
LVVEWRRGSRTRMVCGLEGPPGPRQRSVPSDASAARGGGETVPLVESAFTVAKAATASDVRRLGRMDAASEVTFRLLARLRLMGDGGSVVGLDSRGCWMSSVMRIGQRWTRRRKPCVDREPQPQTWPRFMLVRTFMTPKLANLRTSMPRLRASWSCIHSKTVFPGFIREYR